MPALNKQTLINLLIDSPLREPIKINLIDIVNNTKDEDLPKVYPTITKELEIFQKATDRRLKLADETVKKLAGETPASPTPPPSEAQTPPAPTPPTPIANNDSGLKVPPLDLPPLPAPSKAAGDVGPTPPATPPPTSPAEASSEGAATTKPTEEADEAALKEIQKELDALKGDAATDAGTPPAPAEPAKE